MRAPAPPDEPRFVLAARTMVESGQWLLPHRGIELYAEKPPVFMWMQAGAYSLIRNWNVAFLLPSLLAALATLWMTYRIGAMLWSRRIGRYAALALFATLQFGLMAKRAQIDMVLLAMMTASLWGLLAHLWRGPNLTALLLGAFAAGLGTVTKGVGFLPLLLFVSWLTLRFKGKVHAVPASSLQWFLIPLGFALGLSVWLLPLGIALAAPHGAELDVYARELLYQQTATRYAGAWHHIQPAWYYVQVMLTLWLPGCLLLPWILPAWARRISRGDSRYWLLLGWAALVLVFFSASPGKREVYILPALPALCVAAAPLLEGLLRQRYARWTLTAFPALIAMAALIVVASIMGNADWLQSRLAGRDLTPEVLQALTHWLLFIGVAMLLLVAAFGTRRPAMLTVLSVAVLWTSYGFGLLPALDASASSRQVMQQVHSIIGTRGELGLVDWREQNYLQVGSSVPADFGFKQPSDVQWHHARKWVEGAPGRRWILVTDKAIGRCVNRARSISVGSANRNNWVLVPSVALVPGCREEISWAENDEQ
ncbi:ArnT family glycosyltransferase [Stenotrophomonas sp. 2MCAF14_2]|uniref:ArnT family glycosyltransferase n=1 Tax=Stenotrophomonas sp. 2MCAF14_2 TaxID=3232983 RepID=UPI003F99313D